MSYLVLARKYRPSTFSEVVGQEHVTRTLGNAFATEPVLWQSAYFRQPNRDRTVSGLYYVGAGTHPGGGIPGVILGAGVTSGVIAADLASGRLTARPMVAGPKQRAAVVEAP